MRIPEFGKRLLVKSGIQLKKSGGIPTNGWNPESKFHYQRFRNPQRGIHNPRLSWIPLCDELLLNFGAEFACVIYGGPEGSHMQIKNVAVN